MRGWVPKLPAPSRHRTNQAAEQFTHEFDLFYP